MMMDFKGNTKKIFFLWVATSLILGVIAYPLTFLMPLNKRLWSISFVFLTSGITGLSLAFVTFFIDVLGKRYAKYGKIINKITTPFLWLGMNPLAIYVLM
jgi:heparan-alpha-glucosaminide N-acetyltransferase